MTTNPDERTIIAQLKAMGFTNEIVDEPRRLIVSISGRDGTGKSHFLFTAPEPIFLFDIDIGTEGVVKKFQVSGKDIYIYSIRVPKGARQDVYRTMWADVKERITTVYKLQEGTLGMDTATEAFELARLSHFGKLTQVMPHHYTEVNSEWREVLRQAYDSRMNTILIHKDKPVYINDKRTKDYEIAGFGETSYIVQANLVSFKELDADGNIRFGYRVEKCRKRPSLTGNEYRTVLPVGGDNLQVDPVVNFEFLLGLVHD